MRILPLFLFFILFLTIPLVSAGYGIDKPSVPTVEYVAPTTSGTINVSGESVNDSTYWQGLIPSD